MPNSFDELETKELYRSAIEDFAVAVADGDKESKKVILASLLESGVTWKDYVEQHPEVAPVVVEETKVTTTTKKTPGNVVTSTQTSPNAGQLRYREPEVNVTTNDFYLVKMDRDNPYFEFGNYRFTKKDPFVPMDAESTNAILTEERGFSIATPAEAQEYYGL